MTDFTDTRLRIVFAGTPDFAAHHLQALLDEGTHEVVAVYTQPDRPKGRGKQLAASPVKELALAHNLPVYQPQNLKSDDDQQQLAALDADIMVVVAYGLLLPQAVLDIPRLGCINVHASLLPRWRGAAPIQRAIEAGDAETGVTIMQMAAGLDTGDMLVVSKVAIDSADTAASLHDKLLQIGGPALLQALGELAAGEARPTPQDDEQANYAHKLSKQEALVDWQQSAEEIHRRVRAFNPIPVACADIGGQRVRLWQAKTTGIKVAQHPPGEIVSADEYGILVACGDHCLRLTELQLPGKKRLPAADILRGNSDLFTIGSRFTSDKKP
ncbi:methionyl-tRNA formyltransferase [Porticoccus sp. W117]|uniref:methionyl-tRNA formyltransferase n=1 Tax=Porticoccus sp. W117 TaxID=3054777 RepID=UPI0025978E74|nr:methionyl-tRNA formyltransferase [Porticoccus sp. W117]MDM3870453.1 methionyl-tRNA formyltransferase [Porticoccus sp. W117]